MCLCKIRQPSGTTVTGIVPTNTYPCKDGKHVIIGGNGDSIYIRLMNAIGRSDLVREIVAPPPLERRNSTFFSLLDWR